MWMEHNSVCRCVDCRAECGVSRSQHFVAYHYQLTPLQHPCCQCAAEKVTDVALYRYRTTSRLEVGWLGDNVLALPAASLRRAAVHCGSGVAAASPVAHRTHLIARQKEEAHLDRLRPRPHPRRRSQRPTGSCRYQQCRRRRRRRRRTGQRESRGQPESAEWQQGTPPARREEGVQRLPSAEGMDLLHRSC